MGKMSTLDWISFVLLVIGGLNWGLVGAFNFDLVQAIFGANVVSDIVYILVGIAAIVAIISAATKKPQ